MSNEHELSDEEMREAYSKASLSSYDAVYVMAGYRAIIAAAFAKRDAATPAAVPVVLPLHAVRLFAEHTTTGGANFVMNNGQVLYFSHDQRKTFFRHPDYDMNLSIVSCVATPPAAPVAPSPDTRDALKAAEITRLTSEVEEYHQLQIETNKARFREQAELNQSREREAKIESKVVQLEMDATANECSLNTLRKLLDGPACLPLTLDSEQADLLAWTDCIHRALVFLGPAAAIRALTTQETA